MNEISEAELERLFSDEVFISNVCLSYRHDYGLLSTDERIQVRYECKRWLQSILKNLIDDQPNNPE